MAQSLALSHPTLNLSTLYQWIDPFVSSYLICREDRDKILQYSSTLPPFFTPHVFCYEFPLNHKKRWTDFAFQLLLFNSYLQKVSSCPLEKSSWQWERIFYFLRKGGEKQFFPRDLPSPSSVSPSFFSSAPIRSLWLEFDLGSAPHLFPQPNIMLGLGKVDACLPEVSKEIFYWIRQEKMPNSYLSFLKQCNNSPFQICSLSFMLARPSPAFYLHIENHSVPSSSELSSYLRSLSHPSLDSRLLQLYEIIRPHLSQLNLHVGIEQGPLPYVNFICTLDKGLSLLDPLTSLGLIQEKEKKELLYWIGEQIEPQCSYRMKGLLGTYNDQKHLIIRRLGHIKLTYASDLPLQVKAYIGAIFGLYLQDRK